MEDMDQIAEESVGRGAAFVLLAIAMVAIALSGAPSLMLKVCGGLLLLMAAVLLTMAERAYAKPYKETELWLMLPVAQRPPEPVRQRLIALARRRALLRHTVVAAGLATLALVSGTLLGLFA
jgi:cell division protein FtsW (lipid II flippase)